MRIVIDGTVGAGKTTVLIGHSQRDPFNRNFYSFKDMGFTVFSDLIINVIKTMRQQGIEDPSVNWPLFFQLATTLAMEYYFRADSEKISFYDRGIFFLEIMAKRYGYKMPKEYYDFCRMYQYAQPVFIFTPILSLDMTKPHKTDNFQKIYSKSERIKQHQQVIDLYKSYHYEVVEVPIGSNNIYDSVEYRLNFIKEVLSI